MPLHPQSEQFIEILKQQNAPGWNELPLEEARATFASLTELFGEPPKTASIDDVICETVKARIYSPQEPSSRGAIIYFHGGGWVLGNVSTHDTLCSQIANSTGRKVISAEYRLAPEAKFPLPLNDCMEVTRWVAANAAGLKIDLDKLSVAGDSAGGNLAAAVALMSRDTGGPNLESMVLIYPAIDPQCDSASYEAFATDHGLTSEVMRWFWNQYLPVDDSSLDYAALHNAKLSGLPRTLVQTAEYDVLRDEGESFANRLRAAGVETVLERYDGALHGFVHFGGFFDDAAKAIANIANFVG